MTCAKTRVTATITTLDGRVFEGSNDCSNPQSVCPRIAAGSVRDDYVLCDTVCQQEAHAEILALGDLWGAGASAEGATVHVGHWRCCGPCEAVLRAAGVARIVCEAKRPTPIELAAQDQAKLARYLAEAAGSFPERPGPAWAEDWTVERQYHAMLAERSGA